MGIALRNEAEFVPVEIIEKESILILSGNKEADIFKRKEADSVVAIDRNALIDYEQYSVY